MIISFFAYLSLSILIIFFTEPLLLLMATDTSILQSSSQYIKIESIANIFLILSQFILVALISINKSRYLYFLTGVKLLFCIIFDTLFISSFSFVSF